MKQGAVLVLVLVLGVAAGAADPDAPRRTLAAPGGFDLEAHILVHLGDMHGVVPEGALDADLHPRLVIDHQDFQCRCSHESLLPR
ncbi:MAG: hypothetical protein GYA73_06865 [Planctomycetes bacterium]|nr:hypothetical protein [Planctomycetota bacterium]